MATYNYDRNQKTAAKLRPLHEVTPERMKDFLDEFLEDDKVKALLETFCQQLILLGQESSKDFNQRLAKFEGHYLGSGQTLPTRDLLDKVAKAIEQHWGRDAMTTLLARIVVLGEFVR